MLSTARSASFQQAYRLPPASPKKTVAIRQNLLSFKLSGVTRYIQEDNCVTVTPGKLVYIPAGASFRTEIPEPGEYIELWYSSDPPADRTIRVYSDFGVKEMEMLFSKAVSYCAVRDAAAWFNCQAQLELIFALVAHSSDDYLSASMRRQLTPALDYLTENLFSTDFSVGEMKKRVGMSDKHFRKLFVSFCHMTPQRYVITERINYARAILADDPRASVQSVSEAVGYIDPFYFSRLFKKEMGMSPSLYQQLAAAHPGTKEEE